MQLCAMQMLASPPRRLSVEYEETRVDSLFSRLATKRTVDTLPAFFFSLRHEMYVNVISKFSVHFTVNKESLRYQGRQIKAIE